MIFEDLFRNPLHLIILLVVIMMIFGTSKLADAGKNLGRSVRDFKREVNSSDDDDDGKSKSAPAPTPPPISASIDVPAAAAPQPTNGSAMVQALQCPSCHSLNPIGARLCNQCGTSLAAPVS